jgi:hypothetical protein
MRPAADLQLNRMSADFYAGIYSYGSFAEQMNVHIYEIFMLMRMLLICHPHRLNERATCFLGHAGIDISKPTLISTPIAS